MHPSPSARQFRLLLNDLATSELETAHGEPGAAAVAIDDTGETKKAAHRFSAIGR